MTENEGKVRRPPKWTNVMGLALPIKLVGLAIVWLVIIAIPLKIVGRLANISRHFL